MINLNVTGSHANRDAHALALAPTEQKNAALEAIAAALLEHAGEVRAANAIDVEREQAAGLSESLLDRMLLTLARLEGMAGDTRNVVRLPDPVGEQFDQATLPN